ncbi:hypothetical protein MMC21_003009 [Puttea exsequens]|nr:hypothetical protein [Puttea exsequens]
MGRPNKRQKYVQYDHSDKTRRFATDKTHGPPLSSSITTAHERVLGASSNFGGKHDVKTDSLKRSKSNSEPHKMNEKRRQQKINHLTKMIEKLLPTTTLKSAKPGNKKPGHKKAGFYRAAFTVLDAFTMEEMEKALRRPQKSQRPIMHFRNSKALDDERYDQELVSSLQSSKRPAP